MKKKSVPAANRDKIQHYKKELVQGFFIIAATLIAFTAFCLAWFVSNTKVSAETAVISAQSDTQFLLASEGDRQEPEWKDDKVNLLELFSGSPVEYTGYYDTASFTKSTDTLSLYTGTSGLAWRLAGQQYFYPGAAGKLELYFIPQKVDLQQIKIDLNIEPKIAAEQNAADGESKIKTADATVQQLVNGHILFFSGYNENTGYSGLLGIEKDGTLSTKSITVNANDFPAADGSDAKAAAFEKGVPYKVTVWWKWPKIFHNYVYNEKYYDDLFLPLPGSNNTDYETLNNFINKNRTASEAMLGTDHYATDLFLKYASANNADAAEGSDTGINIQKINASMTQEVFNECTTYYDLADEYLGNSTDYIYVIAEVENAA